MSILELFKQYGFLASPLLSGLGLVVLVSGVGMFVKRSRENGLIESDRERTKQLTEENNYLKDKNNYLTHKTNEIYGDLQRQINNLSRELSEVVNFINSTEIKKPQPQPKYIKPIQPPTIVRGVSDDDVEFELPQRSQKQPRKPDTIGRKIVEDVLSDFNNLEY